MSLSSLDNLRLTSDLAEICRQSSDDFHSFLRCGQFIPTDDYGKMALLGFSDKGFARAFNVFRCKSPYLCVDCSRRLAGLRGVALADYLGGLMVDGLSCYFLTLTVRHSIDDTLQCSINRLQANWKRLTNSKAWSDAKKLGMQYVRFFEVVRSDNTGWHPHFHIILYSKSVDLSVSLDSLIDVWCRKNAGVSGQNLQRIVGSEVGFYASKVLPAFEVSGGTFKRGRRGSKSFWELVASGDVDNVLEFVRVMKGKRQFTRSCDFDFLESYDVETLDDVIEQVGLCVCVIDTTQPFDWNFLTNSFNDFVSGVIDGDFLFLHERCCADLFIAWLEGSDFSDILDVRGYHDFHN